MRLANVAKEYLSHVPEPSINNGHCYVWAWIVAAHIPTAKLWSDTLRMRINPWGKRIPFAYHAFIRIGNRFFDSDSPHGYTDPRWLRCFCINPCDPDKSVLELSEQHTPKSFWEYWQDAGDWSFEDKLIELYDHNSMNKEFIRTIKRFNRKHGIRF